MTHRIYYTDASTLSFDATVLRVLTHGGQPAVVLDRTAFYPTSGGQPFDTGRLADARVVDVVDLEDGDIVHVLDAAGPALQTGATVRGAIDAARRQDHMQQHTGQHVLSAAFDRLWAARTVSFHLGADAATIDLSPEVTPEQIAGAEAAANAVVFEDRPVTVRFASSEDAAALPLRKDPARTGELRLVEVHGFDLSACGGTHVPRTGAIGLIAVLGWERFKGGTRVTFACGGRALTALRTYRDAIAGSVRQLSVLPEELPSAIARLQNESKDVRRSLKQMQEQLAGHEAARLVNGAEMLKGRRLIAQALDGWDAGGLKAVAAAATAADDVAMVLCSTAAPVAVVVARSKNVPIDAQAILKQLLARFGGKGGGKPEMAQGGGLTAEASAIITTARDLLTS